MYFARDDHSVGRSDLRLPVEPSDPPSRSSASLASSCSSMSNSWCMLPLMTGDLHCSFEQERRASILYQLSRNSPDIAAVVGVFREYEDYGLPGYTPLDADRVRSTTFALMQALKYNTQVTEFVLNVKALELLLDQEHPLFPNATATATANGICSLLHFLKHNSSLKTLNIRIPPGTKESEYFVGLFTNNTEEEVSIQCPNLKEITLWIPRERPQRLRMMRMMMRHPSTKASTTAAVSTETAARIHPFEQSPPAVEDSSTADLLPRNRTSTRSLSPRPPMLTLPCIPPAVENEATEDEEDDYDLSGIARFVAQQPRLFYVRVQASSLTVQQWEDLTRGLATSQSLRHVELRRVEVDSTSSAALVRASSPLLPHGATTAATLALPPPPPATCTTSNMIAEQLAVLGRGLNRIDLFGTSIDISPLLIQKAAIASATTTADLTATGYVPRRQLNTLSWSSANLVNMPRLMDALSLPSATVQILELSHLNLSGPKCRCLAGMLQRNTSIRHLNLSRAQLDCVDASHLAKALLLNDTLLHLNLMDNVVWRSTPNALNIVQHQESESDTAIVTTSPDYYATLAFHSLRDLLGANTKLEVLDIGDNGLDALDEDERYGILLQGLQHNTHLKSLKVCNQANLFLDTLQMAFGGPPRQFHLSVSQHLGNVLQQNSCLQELVLNYNRFQEEHLAEYMAPALRYNTTLRVLGLKRVRLGNTSMVALAKGLVRHPALESLDVSYNINVTEQGYRALSNTIRTLPRLRTLWFHTMARHREEDAMSQHRFTLILAEALEDNTSVMEMSHSEILEGQSKFYLLLNQYDRKRLCRGGGIKNNALWPQLLASMPLDLVAFYVRRNATLLASVSSQREEDEEESFGAKRQTTAAEENKQDEEATRSLKRQKLAREEHSSSSYR
jgi:Ran GTPase-activating protein (RanGAP) involved in mRNA processing and transport